MRKYLFTILFVLGTIFFPVTAFAGISDGLYELVPKCSTTRALTIKDGSTKSGANAYIYRNTHKEKQIFYIETLDDGTCTIMNCNSGKVVEAAGTKNGANVRQNSYRNLDRQTWVPKKSGSYYVFLNEASGKAMSVKKSQNADAANVYLYKYCKTNGQKFILKHASLNDLPEDVVPFSENEDVNETAKPTATYTSSTVKTTSRNWKSSDYNILTNIIGAVESGGQIYGKRNYAAYDGVHENTDNEITITIGWAQYYGYEAQRLIQNIYLANKTAFRNIDKKGVILRALKNDWVATEWDPSSSERKLIVRLITSSVGKKCQDELFKKYMEKYVADCKNTYTKNAAAIMMYCEIRHLGGQNAAARIFDRCKGNYSIDNIMKALKADQKDTASSSQVGDELFWSRHMKCSEFVKKYVK